jgi:hypothetical protein
MGPYPEGLAHSQTVKAVDEEDDQTVKAVDEEDDQTVKAMTHDQTSDLNQGSTAAVEDQPLSFRPPQWRHGRSPQPRWAARPVETW